MLSQFVCVGTMAHIETSVNVDLGMYAAVCEQETLKNLQNVTVSSAFVSPQQGEHGLDEHKLHTYLSALQSLIPPLFAVVLLNAPFTSRAKPHPDIPAIEGRTKQTRPCVRRQYKRLRLSLLFFILFVGRSDPVPSAGFPPPGCGHHHRQQGDAERPAAPLRPPAGTRGHHQLGQPAVGRQPIVSQATIMFACAYKHVYLYIQTCV